MFEIMILLFPSCVSMFLHNHIYKKEHNTKEFILLFCTYASLVNLCTLAVLYLYASTQFYLNENFYRLAFAVRYLGLSLIFAVLVPVVLGFINKNFTVKLDFKKVNRSEKNRKKRS